MCLYSHWDNSSNHHLPLDHIISASQKISTPLCLFPIHFFLHLFSKWVSLIVSLAAFSLLWAQCFLYPVAHLPSCPLSPVLGGFHLPSHPNIEFISNHFLPCMKSFRDFLLFIRMWTAVSVMTQAGHDVTLVHSPLPFLFSHSSPTGLL